MEEPSPKGSCSSSCAHHSRDMTYNKHEAMIGIRQPSSLGHGILYFEKSTYESEDEYDYQSDPDTLGTPGCPDSSYTPQDHANYSTSKPAAPASTSLEDDLSLLADVCDQQVSHLTKLLQRMECKYSAVSQELTRKDQDSVTASRRLAKTEEAVQLLKQEFEHLRELEQLRRREVCRLEAVVEAERLQHSLAQHRLASLLAEEQGRADRARQAREDAVSQKEDALAELACAYADMEAMQATLADSAVYVRYLRRKVLELELEVARTAAAAAAAQNNSSSSSGSSKQEGKSGSHGGDTHTSKDQGAFSMSSIKAAICHAVEEAFQCGEEEKRKRLKQLQLRWHPDKNPVLTEVATEVTKLIHEAVATAEASASK